MASGEVSLVPLIVLKPVASRLKLILVSFFELEVRGLWLSFPPSFQTEGLDWFPSPSIRPELHVSVQLSILSLLLLSQSFK